jgi:hypothetical protein
MAAIRDGRAGKVRSQNQPTPVFYGKLDFVMIWDRLAAGWKISRPSLVPVELYSVA